MKLKKEYVILILVIAALVLYISVRSRDSVHFELPQLAAVETAKINRMVLTNGDSTIEVVKKDEQWFLEPQGYKADSIKANNMTKAVAELTLTDLISETENDTRYDLSEDKRIHVKAFAGSDLLREFSIGRSAATYQHTFVKVANDVNVYYAKGAIKNTFNHSTADLRDKTVLTFEQNSITQIELKKDDQTIVLSKKEITPEKSKENEADQDKQTEPEIQWHAPDGKPRDKSTVDRLLSQMSSLKCEDFIADKTKQDYTSPQLALRFKNDQGQYNVSVYAKADEDAVNYPAISSDNAYPFEILSSRVESFKKDISKLLPKEEEPKEKAKEEPDQ